MIRFACPTCNAVFTVGDEKAGKTTNCPKCRAPFQIPEIDPPPAKPAPPKRRPVDDDVEVVEERPRPRPRRDEDEDDRPRRRPNRDDYDDEDDRPRRRSRRDDDDDDYDDRPRRRSSRDEDEDERPRKKKKSPTRSGMILACGITGIVSALVMAVVAIMDLDEINFTTSLGRAGRDIPTQVQMFLIFYQVAVYGSLLTALIFLIGSIGLILHLTFGRTVSLVAGGFSCFMIFSIVLYSILALTYSPPGGRAGIASEIPVRIVLRVLLRIAIHVVPVVMIAITLFKIQHTKHLRSNL